MGLSWAEQRTLSDLSWLTAERVQDALQGFEERLSVEAVAPTALGRYCRAAAPVLRLWSRDAKMIWMDPDNEGYLEFDAKLRMAINPHRIVPFWTSRPAGWGEFPGTEALRRAFLGFTVGLVHHDVTHLLIWIAHQRLNGFHTIALGEELNCTLWGTTMAQLAVTGQTPDLADPTMQEFLCDSAQAAIIAVHVRDYLKDRDAMLTAGALLDGAFRVSAQANKLMREAEVMLPEHPAAERAYERFAAWALSAKNDALNGGAPALRWSGHQGIEQLPAMR